MKPATTVSKVCRILTEFRSRPFMGVTDLAGRVELLPSDVHRILSSLKQYGFIEQNPQTKTYQLGIALMKLGLIVLQRSELRQAARPFLQRLSDQTGATAHMAIFDRTELDIFLAEQVDGSTEILFASKLGAPISHLSALGKTILANIDREVAMRVVQNAGMSDLTRHGIVPLWKLEADLAKTSHQGFGLDLEESAEGACCIGAPIRDMTGATIGAISVSMDSRRFYGSEPRLTSIVKSTAKQLSAAVGCRRGGNIARL